jgi:hypothetical protein
MIRAADSGRPYLPFSQNHQGKTKRFDAGQDANILALPVSEQTGLF